MQSTTRLARALAPIRVLILHLSLIRELTRREILGRYRGSSFGILWSLISPFLMLCVYTLAFGTIMGGRWPHEESTQAHFSIILFAGLIVHGFFAECFTRAPLLVSDHPNFVKRVVFPLEVLPWPVVFSALFHLAMNLIVFLVLHLIMDGQIAWMTILFPLVILPLVVLTLGISWFLASLGVYLRDIGQITGVVSSALLFLSSAIVPPQNVPGGFQWLFLLNPLTFIINQARNVLLWNIQPDWVGLGAYLLVASILACLGYSWFVMTRKGFADVL